DWKVHIGLFSSLLRPKLVTKDQVRVDLLVYRLLARELPFVYVRLLNRAIIEFGGSLSG
ncbi:unnamed protein product, partial [Linum tenue]